jgi:ABC-2 type transport system ATP-binding protein
MEILRLTNISKKISNKIILDNISLSVNKGEIFGFLGPNGAGKTTTIKIITGLMKPSAGKIIINDIDLQKQKVKAISNLGAIVENPSLYGFLTGIDNLKIVAKLRGVKIKELDYIIDAIGLKDRMKDKVKTYSLGMKERLAIGCALVGNPKLLILDEPTNGLDPEGIIELRNMIKKFSNEYKMTIFLSSHQLNEVQQICNRVAFINKGKIVTIESISDILNMSESLEEKYMKLITKG